MKRADITDLRFHDLRRQFASRLVEKGVPLSQVRDLLGHASIVTTERYDRQSSGITPPQESAAPTIVSLLESAKLTKVFTIWVNANLEKLQADVASWGKPSIAIIRGTVLGAADFTFYYPYDVRRMVVIDGKPVPIARDQWRSLRMEDQADAVLYPGAASTIRISRLSPELCVDSAYMEMRLRRIGLEGLTGETERLKQYCRTAAPK